MGSSWCKWQQRKAGRICVESEGATGNTHIKKKKIQSMNYWDHEEWVTHWLAEVSNIYFEKIAIYISILERDVRSLLDGRNESRLKWERQ